jgi:hypothetical protein
MRIRLKVRIHGSEHVETVLTEQLHVESISDQQLITTIDPSHLLVLFLRLQKLRPVFEVPLFDESAQHQVILEFLKDEEYPHANT